MNAPLVLPTFPACLPVALRRLGAVLLASGLCLWLSLLASAAWAADIRNTATLSYDGPGGRTQVPSTPTVITPLPAPTPAQVTLWQHAPGISESQSGQFDGGQFDPGAGGFNPLPPALSLGGGAIDLNIPVAVLPTRVYHVNAPVFIQLADTNRNTDPAARELIEVTVTTSTGDREVLRLQETGPNTGIFAAALPSVGPQTGVAQNDGRLSVDTHSQLQVHYRDLYYPDDVAEAEALVDPFGIVFDSRTGAPLSGATVTLMNADNGLPAQVFGDDGVSSFPATVITGSLVTDSGGQSYQLPQGGFRFPFVKPGRYRLVVKPTQGYVTPSGVALGNLPKAPNGQAYSVVQGSYADVFVVVPGPALNIDIPADPNDGGLFLQKLVSQTQASAGDFLQYQLLLQSTSASHAGDVRLQDRLPVGMRYQPGSLRLNGQVLPDPAIGADGRSLSFGVGSLAAGASAKISYVVLLGAGVRPGSAVNTASAADANGSLTSNTAAVAVEIKEPLFSSRFTIIGRVFEGACDTPWAELKGLANARVLMEDGTYVVTDKNGQFHFEGVRPGTHVVQLDTQTLGGREPLSCIANTRFAGSSYSQFVDVRGGGLWRADFMVSPKAQEPEASLPATVAASAAIRLLTLPAEAGAVPAQAARNYTFRGRFAPAEASLLPASHGELERLLAQLRQTQVQRLEIIGHTDTQRLSARAQARYADNHALSRARAQTLADYLAPRLGLKPEQVQVSGMGPDLPLAGNDTPAGMAQNRRVELRVFGQEAVQAQPSAQRRTHRLELEASRELGEGEVSVQLPAGLSFVAGSTTLDGAAFADPVLTQAAQGAALSWRLPAAQSAALRALQFQSEQAAPARAQAAAREYTFKGRFAPAEATLLASSEAELVALLAELRQQDVQSLEIVGHTDKQRLSAQARRRYADNQALSQARAQTLAQHLGAALGLKAEQLRVSGQGEREALASNATAAGMAQNRRVEVRVYGREARQAQADAACLGKGELRARAVLKTTAQEEALPEVSNTLACADYARAVDTHTDSGRQQLTLNLAAPAPAERQPQAEAKTEKAEKTEEKEPDWLALATSTPAWLAPKAEFNPRAPTLRVVLGHAQDQVVKLSLNGEPVPALSFDGLAQDAGRQVAVSQWRGLPLKEGENRLSAEVLNAQGQRVATLTRTVHYANTPVRAELVLAQSKLLADGISRPVLALRLLDRFGKPVRDGVTGPLNIGAPYRSAQYLDREQQRQLAGMDQTQPEFRIEGDEGLALVELEPTTESGEVKLSFQFQTGPSQTRKQEISAWLAPAAREWVMVGFAEGTVGHRELKDKMQALSGEEEGVYTDGQISFYAKGRVLGQWLLTMAYDSDKPREREGLLSTIDPNTYYTLYGDGAHQRYDAASQAKLYLKLERGQFYALFGDYETGLNQTQLGRMSRTLNGIKLENGGGPVVFKVYAAETAQNFARDEVQGDGTSGLYRLSRRGIVLNSEKIRIETRDRLRSEVIVQSRQLTRHLDYDIDYDAGTLFFKQPLPSRDSSFNPNIIVAEYETLGVADQALNAGGRLGLNLLQGRLQAGVTALREEDAQNRGTLNGADLKWRSGVDSELRLELAQSEGEQGSLSPEGEAWLAEWEHHSGRVDTLLYARRQEPGFGLKQQNASEGGQQKTGAEAQYRLSEAWALQGQVYQQENLATDVSRDALQAKVQYSVSEGTFSLGAQSVADRASTGALAGRDYRSEQAVLAASRWLWDRRLELSLQAENALGGQRDSIDFPNRYLLGAGWTVNDALRLLAGQEFTDGAGFDTSTSRVGFQLQPWKGARLDSTLNQSQISEYGPRTFAQLGLSQSLLMGERWGVDLAVDANRRFNESGEGQPVVNPASPIAPGGQLGAAALTEDFQAYSAGATYRAPRWSWNGRLESRDGETSDRLGLVSHFLRQAEAGVAFASSLQAFRTAQEDGSLGHLLSLDLSWAWRPLASHWSLLDRLELRYEDVDGGSGQDGLFGQNGLRANTAKSRRLINNLALNRVSREWSGADRRGNLFRRYERNQWSLYYGAKYALDTFDGEDYSGYTDLLGLEVRHDLRDWLDIGLQASSLNAWSTDSHAYSFGPQIGVSPVRDGWITLGYNVRGFSDRDFDAARYTAQGPYLQLRFKFDQNTTWRGLSAARPDAAPRNTSTTTAP